MISYLNGELAHVSKDSVVIDVGGVGYQVMVSQRHLDELPGVGEPLRIFTHLVHREDAMLLFGFPAHDERELFLLLTSVSGIGAKTAMGVLSALSVSEIVTSVVTDNPRRLSQAPGVGKKTAERIVLELREKLQEWQPSRTTESRRARRPAQEAEVGPWQEAELALLALGYDEDEIVDVLHKVGAGADVEETLRRALESLSGV
jgi:Holliday junction DNA helicase RuvA